MTDEFGGADVDPVGFPDSLDGEPGGVDQPYRSVVSPDGGPDGYELVDGNPVGDTNSQVLGVGQTVKYLVT